MKTKSPFMIIALAVTISVQASFAALQGPLPEFKSKAEIDKSAGVSPQRAKSSDSISFYTGKPFEIDQENYLFKYRNYDPALSRWVSVDPSGFPDGANGHRYAVLHGAQLDPNGLDTVTVTGVPQNGSSGSTLSIAVDQQAQQIGSGNQANMQVHWTISGNVDGWVVQHIQFSYSAFNDADNTAYTLSSPPTSSYWEAWKVTAGTVEYGGNDFFQTDLFPESTHGTYSITGKVDFYQNSAVTSGAPSGWGSVPEAGVLLATTSQPSWWTNSGFNHTLNMKWE